MAGHAQMNKTEADWPTRQTIATVTGLSYLGIFVLAIFANVVVFTASIDPNPATTTANINESADLFRIGTLVWLVVGILDLIVAWGLHRLFASVNSHISSLSAWFRLAYSIIHVVAVVFLAMALGVATNNAYASSLGDTQQSSLVQIFIDGFELTWAIGLALFGMHLVGLGFLIARSAHTPTLMGVVIVLAGIGYIVNCVAVITFENYSDYETVFTGLFAVPSLVGEFWLTLWLLIARGGKVAALPNR